jgi:hypothetical protein
MKKQWFPINIYLICLLFLGLACGCQSGSEKNKKKELSTLRLFMETNPDGTERTIQVPVFRERPVLVTVQKGEFLNEGDILNAAVVETMGGFAIKVQYNRHGTWMLENMTSAYSGSRIAIHSQFGEARWLAAPLIKMPIRDGMLVFTPDASREEAERIVHGLNNVAAQLNTKSPFR